MMSAAATAGILASKLESTPMQANRLRVNTKDTTPYSADGFGLATPLHWAAYKGHYDIAELLINEGADINAQTERGAVYGSQTPLHKASQWNHEDIVILLVNKGADIGLRDQHERTAIYYAVRSCLLDSIKLLLAKGADINVSDDHGTTPLFEAITKKRNDILELLIKKGADVNFRDNRGQSPLDYAEKLFCEDIASILRKYGAEGGGSQIQICPRGHGPLKLWDGNPRCLTCGWPAK